MSCKACKHLVDIENLSSPYVVRSCAECGRSINLREPGDNGRGIKIVRGDQLVFPNGWLQIAANPLKGSGRFFKSGLGWFAKLIFVEDIKSESDLDDLLAGTEKYADEILRDSEILKDLDLDSEADGPAGYERIQQDQSTKEWWALLVGTFNAVVRDAIQENNARKAAWAMRASERARAMCVFKIHLEEVVWMGHSASRLVDVIKTWRGNKTNPQEEFWQQVFKENPYVLT
ncbi:hypothetical protein [Cyanobium sp. Lug-B]|uniref:hypothetical protein n=1 Tax=Cyanobium sp. Lug-B TaxID=2823716 RepID=UPI0020CCBFF6|nr:hypothetical protein [Cyanobium sp. Lug-B]MCP9797149.1 hypothetical protein [Cyanobium sp. Lug-B]